jgi:hypothetical protein
MTEQEPKTIPEFAEYYKKRNFNNFFVRLPGTLYRSRAAKDPEQKKLFEDLDREAARLGIDTKAILDEMIRGGNKSPRQSPSCASLAIRLSRSRRPRSRYWPTKAKRCDNPPTRK